MQARLPVLFSETRLSCPVVPPPHAMRSVEHCPT